MYPPNPGAIVVAIDAGHGGCLDWGVPDPSERGQAYAEETLTLGIAQRLEALLVDDGIGREGGGAELAEQAQGLGLAGAEAAGEPHK